MAKTKRLTESNIVANSLLCSADELARALRDLSEAVRDGRIPSHASDIRFHEYEIGKPTLCVIREAVYDYWTESGDKWTGRPWEISIGGKTLLRSELPPQAQSAADLLMSACNEREMIERAAERLKGIDTGLVDIQVAVASAR